MGSADAPDGATWQTKQIWRVMRELCASKDRSLHNGVERESLDYNTVLLKLFKGDERAVQGLVEQQLLSVWHNEPWRDANGVVHDNGSRISAASPLVQACFNRLLESPELSRGLDSMWYMADLSSLEKAVREVEDELVNLRQSAYEAIAPADRAAALRRAAVLAVRLDTLNQKVALTQEKLEQTNAIKSLYLP